MMEDTYFCVVEVVVAVVVVVVIIPDELKSSTYIPTTKIQRRRNRSDPLSIHLYSPIKKTSKRQNVEGKPDPRTKKRE